MQRFSSNGSKNTSNTLLYSTFITKLISLVEKCMAYTSYQSVLYNLGEACESQNIITNNSNKIT